MIQAAVMPGAGGAVDVREIREPDLEPNSALMQVELSEVCGTDVHLRDGRLSGVPYPIIPGHVSVGRIERLRGTMLDVNGMPFEEGDRMTFLDVHGTCGACWHCLVAKASTRCPSRRVYGITYGLEDGLTGGWAQKLYLKPGTRCIRMGDVDAKSFMAGGCSAPTSLHAIDRGAIRIGETVLVLGSGPVGLSSMILAMRAGAFRVLCIGAPASRLEVARRMGADDVLDFTSYSADERLEWVSSHTDGRGADVTIEATGAPEAVVQAMRCTRDAGRVVVVGQYTDRGDVRVNPHLDLNRKHLTVHGCWGSDYSHFHRAVQAAADPVLAERWSLVPMERYGLDKVNEALGAVESGRVVKALIDPSL